MSIDEIKNVILKTGFPLELEISNLLRNKNFEVICNQMYFDEDFSKIREIDIEAVFNVDEKYYNSILSDHIWTFNPRLLIECKKSIDKWIFFESNPVAGWFNIGNSIDLFTQKYGYENSASEELLKNINSHYYDTNLKISSTFYSMFFKNKKEQDDNQAERGKDLILDSISKIIKYMNYSIVNLSQYFQPINNRRDILMYYPIILFDGEMYSVNYEKNLTIEKTNHILYETKIFSKLTKNTEPLYIDIITKEFFTEFIENINKEVQIAHEMIASDKIQKLLNNKYKNLF